MQLQCVAHAACLREILRRRQYPAPHRLWRKPGYPLELQALQSR